VNVCSPVKKNYPYQGTLTSLWVRTGGSSYPPDPTFTAILQHFYRAFMTRSSAPVYTLRGRPWTEAAPATEQGSPRSGHVRVKRSGSGLSRSSGAITYAWRCRQEPASSPIEGDNPCPWPQHRYFAAVLQLPLRYAVPTPGILPVSSVYRARQWRSVVTVGLPPADRASTSWRTLCRSVV
jgi:hypothetical protein